MSIEKPTSLNAQEVETARVSLNSKSPTKKPKGLVFGVVFVLIFVFAGAGYWVWGAYISPQARVEKEQQENYNSYLEWEKNYQEAMRNDTYGGSTPQETLDLFVAALEAEDVELASKYFALNENGERDEIIKNNVEEIISSGDSEKVIDAIRRAIFSEDSSYEGVAWFVVKEKKEITHSFMLKKNKHSNVWKIESL